MANKKTLSGVEGERNVRLRRQGGVGELVPQPLLSRRQNFSGARAGLAIFQKICLSFFVQSLSEGHIDHEQALRGILKPKAGEF